MASLGTTFDANAVEPNQPSEVIPAGKYLMQIVNSEMRQTKSGSGSYLLLELSIIDGAFTNRRAFEILNLDNPNEKAVEIANKTLSAICRATGQMSVSDSEQLHHKTMLVTIKVKPADGQYGPSNGIGGYEAATGNRPAATQSLGNDVSQAEARTQAPAAVAAKSAPWRRTA